MNKDAYKKYKRKTAQIHRMEYRKNWCMVHEDKRYSVKREQRNKAMLRQAVREMS